MKRAFSNILMKKFSYTLLILTIPLLFNSNNVISQNVGINTTTPDPSAILDLQATDKGLLIPNIALLNTTDVITIDNPATSLLVYNTATAGVEPNNVTPGFYYWDGSSWVSLLVGVDSGDAWLLSGNVGTDENANFVGTTDNQGFSISTNDVQRIRVSSNGLVGVNTLTPDFQLDVNGKARIYTSGANMGNDNQGQLEISGLLGTDNAYISFYKPGIWGAHFGLDDDNWLSTRGWSSGPTGYNNLKAGAFASISSPSFLFQGGLTDGTHDVVMRNDGNNVYFYPWGTPNPGSNLYFGTAAPVNVRVYGRIQSFGGSIYLDGGGWVPTFSNNDGELFKANDVPASDKPIFIRRYSCNNCDNPDRNTGVSATDYVAVVAGFYPVATTGASNAGGTRSRMYVKNGTWWFKGDIQIVDNESWDVDIMFIKNYFVNDERPAQATGGGIAF